MAATPPSTPVLTCKECGYANEPERVYCHNCGAKLDRSVLPKEEEIRRESPDKARRRIMRMANPPSTVIRNIILAFVKTFLLAFLAACLIEAVRPPEGVPPAHADSMARLITSDLETLVQSPQPRAFTLTETDLNGFLRTGRVKAGAGTLPGVEFKRLYVNLLPGVGRVVVEKTVWGYSIYIGALYRAGGTPGALTAANQGGYIGRLPLHPLIMDRLSPFVFGQIAEALKRECNLLKQMKSVTFGQERVELVGGGRP